MRKITGFTIHRKPYIDSKIAKHMSIISTEIVRTYGKVDSIILAGGFGKGEGSIKTLPTGQVVPLKDYDMFIVTDRVVGEEEHLHMIKRIYEKIGMKSARHFSVTPTEFTIGIQVIPRRKLTRLPPDISNIDLKIASKIIYGEDHRNEIPLSPNDIILSSGFIILFNKVIGMLEKMKPNFLVDSLNREEKEAIIYQCGKAFMEMSTALLIMAGSYTPYYRERAKRFLQIFPTEFPNLHERLPDLHNKVAFFTRLKLNSKFDEYKQNAVTLWFDTRGYLLEVIRYYIQRALNIATSTKDWKEIADEMYRKMGSEFFNQYLHYILREKRWYHPSLLPLISFVGQIYDNLLYIRRVRAIKKKLYLIPMRYWRSPLIKIFSASLLTFCAIHENGTIDNTLLDRAYFYIRSVYPCDKGSTSSLSKWNNVRIACVEAQKTYGLNVKRTL